MNSFLKVLALVSAIATPLSFALEINGVPLPTLLNFTAMLGMFVANLMVLTLVTDYTRVQTRTLQRRAVATAGNSRTVLPLAA